MLLDIVVFVFAWMGILFSVAMPFITTGTDFDFLPWPILGVIFFMSAIGIIRWRGHSTTAWLALDFPSPNEKIGLTTEGPRIYLQKLFPSIAEFMKNKKDWYYKENTEGAYTFGGHDTRLIDGEVAYCVDTSKAHLVNKMEGDFYDYEQMSDVIKKEMSLLKNDKGIFLLTGLDDPIDLTKVDIENNKFHKEVFELLCDKYFIQTHGKTFSLKAFKRFQDKQAAPYQIGSIVHYVKALTAMRAAGVRKGMGGMGKIILIVLVVVIILALLALLLTGNLQLPGIG